MTAGRNYNEKNKSGSDWNASLREKYGGRDPG